MGALRIKDQSELDNLIKQGKLNKRIAQQIQSTLNSAPKKTPVAFASTSVNRTSATSEPTSGRFKSILADQDKRREREHYYVLPEFDTSPDPAVLLYRACVQRWGRYYEGGLVVGELIIKYPRAFRADVAIPKYRICIEMDGFKYHSTKSALKRDHDKTEQLAKLGWIIFRVGAKRIFSDLDSLLDSIEHLMQHSAEGEFVVKMNGVQKGKQSFFSTLYAWHPTSSNTPQSFTLGDC